MQPVIGPVERRRIDVVLEALAAVLDEARKADRPAGRRPEPRVGQRQGNDRCPALVVIDRVARDRAELGHRQRRVQTAGIGIVDCQRSATARIDAERRAEIQRRGLGSNQGRLPVFERVLRIADERLVIPGGRAQRALEPRVDGKRTVVVVDLARIEAAVFLDREILALPLLDLAGR